MTNTSRISFKQLQQEGLRHTFESFQKALHTIDIDFYIIGAIARDAQFARKGRKAIGTRDMDFAILISDAEKYQQLKAFLIKEEGFYASKLNEYVLFDRKGQQVDLLPFGAIEIEGNSFIDSTGVIHRDISGFKEVYEAATEEIIFEDDFNFKVSTLAGIVILKLIAYDDRPEIRSKDILDIGIILNNYFDLEAEMIYRRHSDLFAKEEKSLVQIAARVLGREMQAVLNRNSLLKQRILSILSNDVALSEKSRIALLLLNVLSQGTLSIEQVVNLLSEMIYGIGAPNDNA